MVEFGKRGVALKPVAVATSRSATGSRLRFGGGLLAALFASAVAWVGVSLAETMHTFFGGLFVLASVMYGLSAGEPLRAARVRFAAGQMGLGALGVIEALICAIVFERYLVTLYHLEMSVRLGSVVGFLVLAAPGLALTLYMQTPHYARRLRAHSEGARGDEA